MATTGAPANIPLFDDNSPVTPIQAPLNAMATALNNYLKSIDTGWQQLSLPNGLSGDFYYRVKAGITYFMGNVKLNSGTFPNGYTQLGTLPAGARPGRAVRAAVGMYNGITCLFIIGTDGVMQVGVSTAVGTADTFYVGNVSYPANN